MNQSIFRVEVKKLHVQIMSVSTCTYTHTHTGICTHTHIRDGYGSRTFNEGAWVIMCAKGLTTPTSLLTLLIYLPPSRLTTTELKKIWLFPSTNKLNQIHIRSSFLGKRGAKASYPAKCPCCLGWRGVLEHPKKLNPSPRIRPALRAALDESTLLFWSFLTFM